MIMEVPFHPIFHVLVLVTELGPVLFSLILETASSALSILPDASRIVTSEGFI
jgi:hypothetical protein